MMGMMVIMIFVRTITGDDNSNHPDDYVDVDVDDDDDDC